MIATNKTFQLGNELAVNRIGYGAMRLTGQPGNFGPYPQWENGKALLQRAVELGVNFFDSARSYGPEYVDRLIGEAINLKHSPTVVATKGGIDKPAPGNIQVDGSAATLTRQIDDALKNLKVDRIDLFQLHRIDPKTPIEESVEALRAAQTAGKIRLIGLSNVNRVQLDQALSVAPIASIQNRFNQAEQEQNSLVDYTAQRGIAFIPYGPLGANPMKQGATLPAQAALAWLLMRSPNIIVIPGTTSIAHLEENMTAWNLVQ
ncbi:oxidoreductase, aldo/keto reductase family [Synechococcus sp. PCC 7335]|uniref:aldo/keto reductase n=1 Tax=Synechococcus sp. (strain ATCC 29403 / PCC 7335) TaxID=91464 RepID=UPI00017EB4B3|nr:aldo/keto reductase [Synechococcus sp. PCC 7335]EDX83867.1 oxidoreductase, aldo/keto reductase family [Synechococcus sp. PCC 7335]